MDSFRKKKSSISFAMKKLCAEAIWPPSYSYGYRASIIKMFFFVGGLNAFARVWAEVFDFLMQILVLSYMKCTPNRYAFRALLVRYVDRKSHQLDFDRPAVHRKLMEYCFQSQTLSVFAAKAGPYFSSLAFAILAESSVKDIVWKVIKGVEVEKYQTWFDAESHPRRDSFVLEYFCQLLLRAFLQLFAGQRKLHHRPRRYPLPNQNTGCLLINRSSLFLLPAALAMKPRFFPSLFQVLIRKLTISERRFRTIRKPWFSRFDDPDDDLFTRGDSGMLPLLKSMFFDIGPGCLDGVFWSILGFAGSITVFVPKNLYLALNVRNPTWCPYCHYCRMKTIHRTSVT